MFPIFNPFAIVSDKSSDKDIMTTTKKYQDYVNDIIKSSLSSFEDIDLFRSGVFTNHQIGVEQFINEYGSLSILVDVPGIKEQDLNIEVKSNVVSITGTRKSANSEQSISKSFTVPNEYSTDNIHAELTNGVLILICSPKQLSKESEVKKIAIKSPTK